MSGQHQRNLEATNERTKDSSNKHYSLNLCNLSNEHKNQKEFNRHFIDLT